MKSGVTTSAAFERAVKATPTPTTAVELHIEPEEPIRLLGLMVQDGGVMRDLLAGIVFADAGHYKANLRVIRSAAERMIRRCDRLLGPEG